MTQSNNPALGGRGKRAPYQTTHYRIPAALKPTVELMANAYRELIVDYDIVDDPALIAEVLDIVVGNPKSLQQDIESLEKQLFDFHKQREKVITILKSALLLRANAGGAIKEEIRNVIELMS